MMIKNKIPLIIAIVSGILAVILINVYLRQKESFLDKERDALRRERSKAQVATVLVAARDIPAGTSLQENMVEHKDVPKEYLQPRAVTSIDRAINKITSADIAKGEQVLLSKLAIPTEETSLASKTPAGKRAVTIPIDNIAAVGGMLRPEDYVDVIGLIPIPGQTADGKQIMQPATVSLFQNVLILAVGTSIGPSTAAEAKRYKAEEKAAGSNTVTLALTPQEASLISFFLEQQGKVRLVLRSPADANTQPPVMANWDTLLQYIYPEIAQQMQAQQGEPVSTEKTITVEIYRGSQREIVPLIKSK